jgi:arylsulfatase A-like enzyme
MHHTHRFVLSLVAALCLSAVAKDKPNILLVLSDDMGFSDLGCYGGEIATPNLDALARNGLRFTQFYNTGRCCPTRASLLTGLYPHQAGVGHMTDDRGFAGYRGTLNRQSVTLAEVLRAAGYRTYLCGKWHVVQDIRPDGDKSAWPLQRGFEKFYGTITGGGSFYDPTTLCRQNRFITPDNDPEYQPARFYYTDAISDNAVRFLQQHEAESSGKPFFLYVAYTAAHWPLHALEKDIAKYRGKYDGGFAPIRRARFERMKQLGLIDAHAELSPPDEDWDKTDHHAWNARCMEVYAAMIDCLDQGIGRIVSALKRAGRLENTLIFFLQDNGGCAEGMGRTANAPQPPRPLKPLGPDELQPRIWPPMQTRDGRWVRTGPDVMPGPPDTYMAYGRGWANVSNTPFREYKHWIHEGGISTPLIVHWPAGLATGRRGKLERQPGHLVDIMATCVDVAGAKYPTEVAGEKIKPREGVSLAPAFQGKPLKRRRPICWEHEGHRAVRDGKWKLVAKENQPWELYDLEKDRSELHDLSAARPKMVAELAAQWAAWAARSDVLPLGGWRSQPAVGRKKTE